LGSVKLRGKEFALTGKLIQKSALGAISRFEIEVATKGFLGGRAFGGVEFTVNSETNEAKIVSINSIQALRGQKVGERMYGAAFSAAKEKGVKTFSSDKNVSLPAARTWREIGKKIGNVKERPSTNDGQQLTSKDGKGVFSLDLGKTTAAKISKLGK